jgi:hypothetical protein
LGVSDLNGQTREIGCGLNQRAQARVTRGEIGQLPLELTSDAVEVAAALRQQAIHAGLGLRRQIPLPNENGNGITKGIDAANSWLTLLENDRYDVSQLGLAHERW